MYYEATYHLVPEVGAEHQYALLVTALRRSGRVGIGRLVMRHKGHLCMVRPFGRGLALTTLYYAEELVPQDTLVGAGGDGSSPRRAGSGDGAAAHSGAVHPLRASPLP